MVITENAYLPRSTSNGKATDLMYIIANIHIGESWVQDLEVGVGNVLEDEAVVSGMLTSQ
jgi:hypothetical protein